VLDSLDPLQQRILRVLAGLEPPWTLTGGAALAGFHLGHRTTRDLDLFWHGTRVLGEWADQVQARLRDDGLDVARIQTAPGFRRLRVDDGRRTVIVDLVAESVPFIEAPVELLPGIHVDTPHEILVNKLCALLSRSESRDLVDVAALLEAGGDLQRAIEDASAKDGGFSPLTLAWVLQSLDSAGDSRLESIRDSLVSRLVAT